MFSKQRSLFLLIGTALLLAFVVPPYIHLHHFRRNIVQSISDGLGRPVRAGTVEFTLFPRPAFVLHDFAIEEDPSYGAEPSLMAETVTASLRASTLWHRRLEIATLHFDAPSLNLARNPAGRWSFESLLRRSGAARAASSENSSRTAPFPFPYVEASEARINFKRGAEKLPFSLEGADLAVWKESGNEWHFRLRARPVRTDLTVADAGQVRGEGVLHVSGPLENDPLNFHAEWRKVELGDINRMFRGEDNNWRGLVDWTAQGNGTLANLQLSTDVQVAELRRFEFVPPSEMDISAHCTGLYTHLSNALNDLHCSVPMGTGALLMAEKAPLALGDRAQSSTEPQSSSSAKLASVTFQHVPAEYLIDLFGHVHPGVFADLSATGEVNGSANCGWPSPDLLNGCTGQIHSTPISLSSAELGHSFRISPLVVQAFEASSQISSPPSGKVRKKDTSRMRSTKKGREEGSSSVQMRPAGWVLAPGRVWLSSAAAPASLTGTLNSTGAMLQIGGSADPMLLFKLARAIRLPVFSGAVRSVRGNAIFQLALNTHWLPQPAPLEPGTQTSAPFLPSHWTGSMQLHNATIRLSMFPRALHLASARITLGPGMVAWSALRGTFGGIPFDGNLTWQIPCPASTLDCNRSFQLHTSALDVALLTAVLHPHGATSGLLKLVAPWTDKALKWPRVSGFVDADALILGHMTIKNAALGLSIAGHKAVLTAFRGNVFGGTIAGENKTVSASNEGPQNLQASSADTSEIGSFEWGVDPPRYSLRALLKRIQPNQVGALWHEPWGAGQADAMLTLMTKGWSADELTQNMQGKFKIDWRNGSLTSSSAAAPNISFRQWRAKGSIADEKLNLATGQMKGFHLQGAALDRASNSAAKPISAVSPPQTQPAEVESVSGTITFGRVVHLTLQPADLAINGKWSAIEVAPQTSGSEPQSGDER